MTKRFVLAAHCGTCDHQHPMGGCAECHRSAGQNCPGWTAHTDDVDEVNRRELAEIIALEGKMLMSVYESAGILNALTGFEEQLYAGPDSTNEPVLAVFQLGPSHKHFSGAERYIRVNRLRLADDFWRDKTSNPLDLLAEVAKEWHRLNQTIDPDRPAVAWALVSVGHGVLANDPDKRQIDVHIASGADIDGRAYSVVRDKTTDEVSRAVVVAPGWARLLRGELEGLDQEESARQLEAENLNDGHVATMQLMLVSRMEIENSLAADL